MPRSYLRLAEALGKESADYRQALDRCHETALRDNDVETAAKCAPSSVAAAAKHADPAQGVWVPGGLEALAFIAHSKPKTSPDRFFVEYAKVVRLHKQGNDKAGNAYFEAIREHFELVSALEALGQRDHDKVRITVSLRDKKSQHQTEKILNMLGWKLRVNKNEVTLDAGEKLAQAKRQETTSALAIDEAGMQEALQARQDFNIELRDDFALVLFGADTWKRAFYPKEDPLGGFAGALAHDVRLAKLYAGLSAMDKDAADALLSGTDLKTLADKYADVLYLFSSALALHQTHAAVPGGLPAEAIGEKMAGVSPSRSGPSLPGADREGRWQAALLLCHLGAARSPAPAILHAQRRTHFQVLRTLSPGARTLARRGQGNAADFVFRRSARGAVGCRRQRAVPRQP